MKVSPSGHISGKGYGRDGFIDESSWRAYRDRKNAEGARYNARQKAIKKAAEIQTEVSGSRYAKELLSPGYVSEKHAEMTNLLEQAEATRLVDAQGKRIEGRTVESARQAQQNILQTLYSEKMRRQEAMRAFQEVKEFFEKEVQISKALTRFGRGEIDIIMQQTQPIWQDEPDPNKRFDRIIEHFVKKGESDAFVIFAKILKKAKQQANLMTTEEFEHLMNTSGKFTDEQRRRFINVMSTDNADVVTEYLMIEYTSKAVLDISDVVL